MKPCDLDTEPELFRCERCRFETVDRWRHQVHRLTCERRTVRGR